MPYGCAGGGWTSIESLREILKPQGVTFERTETNWVITFPNGTPAVLSTTFQEMSFYPDETSQPVTLNASSDYTNIRDLIESLRFTNLPVSIEGWENPKITVGSTSFQIDLTTFTPETNYDDPFYTSRDFYSEPISWGILNNMPMSKTYFMGADSQSTATEAKRIGVTDNENAVYGLVVIMDSSKVTYMMEEEDIENIETRFFDIARTDANGKLKFRSPLNQELSFESRIGEMNQVGDALLVRLSGDLTNSSGYAIIPPEQITLE